MIPRILTLCTLLCAVFCSPANSQTWQTAFGGPAHDKTYAVRETPGKELVFTGWTTSFGDPEGDVYLVKTDRLGRELWTKSYGGPLDDGGSEIKVCSDGGYIIAGHTASFGHGLCDFYVVKTDADGNFLWNGIYGDVHDDAANCIVESPDGGFAITGYMEIDNFDNGNHDHSGHSGQTDVCLVRTDVEGRQLWMKHYGGMEGEDGKWIINAPGGGYVIAGVTASFGKGGEDAYVIRVDENGNQMWASAFGTPENERAYGITATQDGGFMLVGYQENISTGDFEVFVVKMNGNGVGEWQKTFGGAEAEGAFGIIQLEDGNFVISGSTNSQTSGAEDMYLLKISPEGHLLWDRRYGGAFYEKGYSLEPCTDGSIVFVGTTTDTHDGTTDAFVVKTDANGLIASVDDRLASVDPEIRIGPNPMRTETVLYWGDVNLTVAAVQVVDAAGKTVQSITPGPGPGFTLTRGDMAPGLYFLRFETASGKAYVRRLLVE